MKNQQIIDDILSKNSELTRDEILTELMTEKQKTGNLLDEKTLLRLIGAKYGIKTNNITTFCGDLLISDLVSGLYNVSVKGRIIAVYPIKFFNGETPGKLASLIISDKTSVIRVILWNEKTEYINSIKLIPGKIVLISQGYTRDDPQGKTELHVGRNSEIKILKTNINPENYPDIQKFSKKINEITSSISEVHLIGTVKQVFPMRKFIRNDASEGFILSFTLFDETGEISVIVWNELAEEMENLVKKDLKLKLINAKVNLTSDNSIELQITPYTFVDVFSEK